MRIPSFSFQHDAFPKRTVRGDSVPTVDRRRHVGAPDWRMFEPAEAPSQPLGLRAEFLDCCALSASATTALRACWQHFDDPLLADLNRAPRAMFMSVPYAFNVARSCCSGSVSTWCSGAFPPAAVRDWTPSKCWATNNGSQSKRSDPWSHRRQPLVPYSASSNTNIRFRWPGCDGCAGCLLSSTSQPAQAG